MQIHIPLYSKSNNVKRKGLKVYILTSECTVIGAWSNLKHLIENVDVPNKISTYYKVYRYYKKHTTDDVSITPPLYKLIDNNGKTFEIKLELIQ